MKKQLYIKKVIIFLVIFVVIFCGFFYFVGIHKAYDKKIFVNPQTAITDWGNCQNNIVFEFKDTNFGVSIDDELNIMSVRKDFLFWVKNDKTFLFADSVNIFNAATVNNTVYLFGITKENGAQNVALLNSDLQLANTENYCKLSEDKTTLFFLLKIPRTELLTNHSIEILDSQNHVIPQTIKKDKEIYDLLSDIPNENGKIVIKENDDAVLNGYLDLIFLEKYYLSFDMTKKSHSLQRYQETKHLYFYQNYVLLEEKTSIFTFPPTSHGKSSDEFYSQTKQFDYTENLKKLKLLSNKSGN